jgi:hypothetical protein
MRGVQAAALSKLCLELGGPKSWSMAMSQWQVHQPGSSWHSGDCGKANCNFRRQWSSLSPILVL